jgi:hypothetical protein
MNLTRTRTTVTLAGAGMTALALSACHASGASTASGSSPSPSRTVAAAGKSSTKDHAAKSHDTDGAPDAGSGGTPDCMAGQLRADLRIRTSNSEAKGIGTLVLTNRSEQACHIPAGWAPIGSGGPHEYTPIPATRTSYPDRGQPLTLHPGDSAYAGMRWHTDAGCTSSGLGVAWHASWIPLTYHALNGRKAPICDHLVIGTLQPKAVNFT